MSRDSNERSGTAILRSTNRALFRGSSEVMGIFALLLVILVIYLFYYRSLLSGPSVVILSAQFLPLVLGAMGQGIVMLTGGIDLSVGAVLSLVMSIFAVLAGTGLGVVGAMAVALAAGVTAGLINGLLVAIARLPPIIVTLAAAFLWSGVTLMILPQPGGSVPNGLVTAYNEGWDGIPIGVAVAVIALVAWKLLSRSPFGLSLYAVGGNQHGAFASGIPVRRVKIWAYGAGGFFVALGGIALTMQTGTGDATLGAPYTLNTIAAAILGGVSFLGGVGLMRGVLMGALVVAILPELLLYTGVSSFYQLVVQGAILIVAIALRNVFTRRKQMV
jgi:ribose transport system permease protein